jgi:hypothetical protein
MKRLILFLILPALIVAGCGPNEVQVVEDLKIDLRVEPDPPAAGPATLYITVAETDGAPIDGATISVNGNMDHEGMEQVDGESDSPSENGEYAVPFAWTMGGGWIVNVTATLPDDRGIAQAQFELFVEAISADSVINQTDNDDEMDMSGNGDDSNTDTANSG